MAHIGRIFMQRMSWQSGAACALLLVVLAAAGLLAMGSVQAQAPNRVPPVSQGDSRLSASDVGSRAQPAAARSNLLGAAQSAPVAPSSVCTTTITGAITSSDPTQTNRLFHTGTMVICGAPGTCSTVS